MPVFFLEIKDIVQFEARKQALLEKKDLLERDADRILDELKLIDSEINSLGINTESSNVAEQVRLLYDRLQAKRKGDVFINFGTYQYRISREIIASIPFGAFFLAYFNLANKISNRVVLIVRRKIK